MSIVADAAWSTGVAVFDPEKREIYFRPVEDGVQMWMRLNTRAPIEGSYLVQQCLRFTGAQNWSLRRHIARAPFLSELDVQAMGRLSTFPDESVAVAESCVGVNRDGPGQHAAEKPDDEIDTGRAEEQRPLARCGLPGG